MDLSVNFLDLITTVWIQLVKNFIKPRIKLDGNYSERVQLPAKAKFGYFVANTWQHLPHLLLDKM